MARRKKTDWYYAAYAARTNIPLHKSIIENRSMGFFPSKHLVVVTRHLRQIEMTFLPHHVTPQPTYTLSSSIRRQAPKFIIEICEIHLTESRSHLGCGEGKRVFYLIRRRGCKIVVGYNKRAQGLTGICRKVE